MRKQCFVFSWLTACVVIACVLGTVCPVWAPAWANDGAAVTTACGNKAEQYPNPKVFYREPNPAAQPGDFSTPSHILTTTSVLPRQSVLRDAVQDGDPVSIWLDSVYIPPDGKKRNIAVLADINLDGVPAAIAIDQRSDFAGGRLSLKDIAFFSLDRWDSANHPYLCIVVMELNDKQNEELKSKVDTIGGFGALLTGLFAPVATPILHVVATAAAHLLDQQDKQGDKPLLQMEIGLTPGTRADSSDIAFRRGGLVVLAPPRKAPPRDFYTANFYLDEKTDGFFRAGCSGKGPDSCANAPLFAHADAPYVVLDVKTASTMPPGIVRLRSKDLYDKLQRADATNGENIGAVIAQARALAVGLTLVEIRDDYKKNPSARKLVKFAEVVKREGSDSSELKWAIAYLRYVTGQTDLDTIDEFVGWIGTCSKWYGFDDLAKYKYNDKVSEPVSDVSCLPPSSANAVIAVRAPPIASAPPAQPPTPTPPETGAGSANVPSM